MEYEIRVERERALDAVTLEAWYGLKEGKLTVVVDVMKKFVWKTESSPGAGDGHYLEGEEAEKVVMQYSFRQVQAATPKLLAGILAVLVPPKNGGGSD